MGLGPVKSVAATVNLNGAADTGHVVQGLVNGQAVGPAYIPSAGSLGYGTVTSVAQTVPAEFAVAGSPVTTSGTLAITKATQTANKVWASATSGGAAQPAFRALVIADLPTGTGTVTSVALTAPAEFSVAGSPVTAAGTLAVTKATQVANTLWAGPTTGANAQPAFRALVAADIPSAYDATLVHIAGTETITGAKTFSANVKLGTGVSLIGQTSTIVTTPIASPANLLQLSGPSFPGLFLGDTGSATTGVAIQFAGTLAGKAKLNVNDGSLSTNVAFGTSGSLYCTDLISTSGNRAFSVNANGTSTGYTHSGVSSTSQRAVLATESSATFDNQGAIGQIEYDLPAGAKGLYYTFVNTAGGASFVKIVANGSDKIAQAGTLGAAGGNLVSTGIWSTITLEWLSAGNWQVISATGSWTLT